MVMTVWLLLITFIMVISSSAVISVFAEVMSLQTNQPFYSYGNKIYFTGTVGIGDYQKLVNLVIHDPMGKFVLISGNYSDSTYTFEMVVDTNNTAQFSTKGIYQAIAFVGKESNGKTLNFDFSPDGSLVTHTILLGTNTSEAVNSSQSLPQHYQSQLNENVGLSNTTENLTKAVIHHLPSTNTLEIANSSQSLPQHYQSQLNENVGLSNTTENLTKAVIPVGKSLNQFDYKNIMYPLISICGVGIVVAILYVRKRGGKAGAQKLQGIQQPSAATDLANPEDDYALMILKNRLAKGEITIEEFKAIKNALDEP